MSKNLAGASKRSTTLVLVAAALGLFAGRARATLLVYEPFNYTVGQGLSGLVDGQTYATGGQTNVTNGYSNKWLPRVTTADDPSTTYVTSVDANISSGNLAYTGLAGSAGQSVNYGANGYTANVGWLNNTAAVGGATPTAGDGIASGNIYYSMIVKIADISNLTAGGPRGILAAFTNGPGATATSNPSSAPGSLWVRQSQVAGGVNNVNFEFGVGKSNTADTLAWDGINHTVGDTLFVVVKYTFNTASTTDDTVSLYVNPSASTLGIDASEGTAQDAFVGPYDAGGGADVGANPGGSIPSIKSFFLRQNGAAGGTTNIPNNVTVDELRIGTTWAEVTPPVPEPATGLIIALGLGGLLARRRR